MDSFAASAFLDVARALTRKDSSQAELRTAIGRAYYAVFLGHVELVAKAIGVPFQDMKHQPHTDSKTGAYFPGFITEVGKAFKEPMLQWLADSLYDKRVAADYRPTNPALTRQHPTGFYINERSAQECIDAAQQFFKLTKVP